MRGRADVSGIHGHHDQFAATRESSGSRVTSSERYVRPFTTRGDSEGKSWFYEKNGRRVLHLDDGRYWRAPRPRPRPNRRRRRREGKSIVQAALHVTDAPQSPTTDAEVVILVLQRSLRNAISREKKKEAAMAEVTEKLEMTEAKLRRAERKRKETKLAHNTELEAATVKLKKAQRKLVEVQQQHTAELSANEEKLAKAQRKIRKLQARLDDTQPQPNKEAEPDALDLYWIALQAAEEAEEAAAKKRAEAATTMRLWIQRLWFRFRRLWWANAWFIRLYVVVSFIIAFYIWWKMSVIIAGVFLLGMYKLATASSQSDHLQDATETFS